MSTKIGSVIAFELALLLGILGWLAFVRLPAAPPPRDTPLEARPAGSFAAVSTLLPRFEERLSAAEEVVNRIAAERSRPEPPFVSQDIVTPQESYAENRGNDFVDESVPAYASAVEQPVIVQTQLIVPPPVQIFQSVQSSQIIVYTDNRPRLPRDCGIPPQNSGPTITAIAPRLGGRQPRVHVREVNPRFNPGPPLAEAPRVPGKAKNSGPRQFVVNQQHR